MMGRSKKGEMTDDQEAKTKLDKLFEMAKAGDSNAIDRLVSLGVKRDMFIGGK